MTAPDWIAVDWGTSSVRAWAMGQGATPLAMARADCGMGALASADFEPALLDLIGDWLGPGRTLIVACGMLGARQGWAEAPYRPVPCKPLDDAPIRAAASDPRVDLRILPGLSQSRPADVMRGEETQISGFLALQPSFDGVLCLPGTHTKWAQISAGEVVSFRSFMTGELFATLAAKTVLRHSMGEGWDAASFDEAVFDALSKPEQLAGRLFALRAEDLLHGLSPGAARARLSGLLIGAELAATRPYWLGQNVAVIGDDVAETTYLAALKAQGIAPAFANAADATLAGLSAARTNLEARVQ